VQGSAETFDSIINVVANVPIEQVLRNFDTSAADGTTGSILSDEPLTNTERTEVMATWRGNWLYYILNKNPAKVAG
jgi:hypothetical protein